MCRIAFKDLIALHESLNEFDLPLCEELTPEALRMVMSDILVKLACYPGISKLQERPGLVGFRGVLGIFQRSGISKTHDIIRGLVKKYGHAQNKEDYEAIVDAVIDYVGLKGVPQNVRCR